MVQFGSVQGVIWWPVFYPDINLSPRAEWRAACHQELNDSLGCFTLILTCHQELNDRQPDLYFTLILTCLQELNDTDGQPLANY